MTKPLFPNIKTKHLAILLLWGILLWIFLLPEQAISGNSQAFGFCLHQKALGFACPGCGMTRAIHAFLHVNFSRATELNIAIWALMPFFTLISLDAFVKHDKLKFAKQANFKILICLLAALYVYRICVIII